MGPIQKAVLRCLAERESKGGSVEYLAREIDEAPAEVHAALVAAMHSGLVERISFGNGYLYRLTPLGERMAEEDQL